jgi:hypothetical protein
MPIAVLVLALVGYVYAMLTIPGFRRPGLIAGALVALGLGFYFWRQDAGPERITPDQLTLDQLDFERTLRGATLSGRVTNLSERLILRDMTLRLTLHDCPEPDDVPATCPIVGEASAIARPGVPPGQIRAFSAHFILSELPPLAGVLLWDLAIAETRATGG